MKSGARVESTGNNGHDKAMGPACRKWASREWCLQWKSHVCKEPDQRSVAYGLATQTVVRGPVTSALPGNCCLEMQKNLRPIQAKSTFHFSQILRWFVGTRKFEKHCLNSSKWSAAEYMFYSECGRVYMFLHHADPDCGDPSNPQTECQGGRAGRPVLGRASKFRPDSPQFPLQHQSYASIW